MLTAATAFAQDNAAPKPEADRVVRGRRARGLRELQGPLDGGRRPRCRTAQPALARARDRRRRPRLSPPHGTGHPGPRGGAAEQPRDQVPGSDDRGRAAGADDRDAVLRLLAPGLAQLRRQAGLELSGRRARVGHAHDRDRRRNRSPARPGASRSSTTAAARGGSRGRTWRCRSTSGSTPSTTRQPPRSGRLTRRRGWSS